MYIRSPGTPHSRPWGWGHAPPDSQNCASGAFVRAADGLSHALPLAAWAAALPEPQGRRASQMELLQCTVVLAPSHAVWRCSSGVRGVCGASAGAARCAVVFAS
eukprot:2597795-Alexandrium_andersonii.AAC.1